MRATNSELATSASAAVLEPSGVHPRPLGQAMKQVVAALSKEQPDSSLAYGVVVYGKSRREPKPNYLATTGIFFRAYLRGLQALSRITHVIVTHPEEDHLQTLEVKDFGDVRFFLGTATPRDVKQKMQPSPGIYIISSHLDASLLEDLRLPLLPESLREVPLVIQVKNTTLSNEAEEATIWRRWEDDAEPGIRKDTLQWRKQFMSEYQCWTAAQVAEESTSLATNRAAIASRWVAEKNIFAIEFEGQKWFPRFQFQNGRPIPAVSKVIEVFPEHATGWDLAYFFVTPNLNIGRRKPFELLKDDPARVVSLAQAFAHPADVF
jgi:hypothetical protein